MIITLFEWNDAAERESELFLRNSKGKTKLKFFIETLELRLPIS